MSIWIKIYSVLVNRVPGIRKKYHDFRNDRSKSRIGAWLYLLGMNVSYYVFHNRILEAEENNVAAEKKTLYKKDSESSLSVRRPPREFADELAEYDVISFDVFDTLIFRPFSNPTDLFYLLEEKNNFMDLHRIRCEAESGARQKQLRVSGTAEIQIEEIYEELSGLIGGDATHIMEQEIAMEYQYCYANPYMLEVVRELQDRGKKVIVISDMYLRKSQILQILHQAGYKEINDCYVSCEYRKSKNTGELYELVRRQQGRDKTYIHVGDNRISDVKQAEKHGFAAEWYENVNEAGKHYRAEDMSVITGGIYQGLVNAHIHNGLNKYSFSYEFGYIYGGLFVAGFCQFIHTYVQQHGIDKVLFLARDGAILQQAYKIMYPMEKTEYVYWSRLAALKLTARQNRYDFFRRMLFHKVNQGYTLQGIFATMELEDMLADCCRKLSVTGDTILTKDNAEGIRNYLIQNWDRVLEHYEEQIQAGGRYYKTVIGDCRHIAVVDIGWAGSGILALDSMLQNEWKIDCRVVGIVAGTTSSNDYDCNITQAMLAGGKLVSYMFSQGHNRDLWKFHDAARNHNLYWELLLSAPVGSFKGFYMDGSQNIRMEFKPAPSNADVIQEINQGILEFVEDYKRVDKDGKYQISGRDAYAPMMLLMQRNNEGLLKNIQEAMDTANVE